MLLGENVTEVMHERQVSGGQVLGLRSEGQVSNLRLGNAEFGFQQCLGFLSVRCTVMLKSQPSDPETLRPDT